MFRVNGGVAPVPSSTKPEAGAMNGHAGKILRVDLSAGKWSGIDTRDYRPWVGGHGMGSAIFYDIVVGEKALDLESVDGFSAENVITMMTSPLCGTCAPGAAARTEVQGIGVHSSPIGWFTRSNFGGRFAAMLKFAGWDGIVLEGAAAEPVWIDIRDEEVSVRQCAELELWGTDTRQCQERIWEKVRGDAAPGGWFAPQGASGQTTQRPAVLAIGPAGENQSRLGALIHDAGSAAGQGGFGGVWGYKKLKAISVVGTGSVHVADPAALLEARLWQKANFQHDLDNEELCKPTFPSYGHWAPPNPGDNWLLEMPDDGLRPQACVGCHAGCRARYQSGLGNESNCFNTAFYNYTRPGTDLTEQAEIQRRAGDLSNLYGVNSHELVYGIPYLLELSRRGELGPGKAIDCPLEFDELGSLEFIERLIRAISHGDDGLGNPHPFGRAVSQGFYRAAESWGRLSGEKGDLKTGLLPFPHWGLPVHLDPRFQLEWGYGTILGDRDANEHDFEFLYRDPTEADASLSGEPLAAAERAVKIYTDKMAPYNQTEEPMRMLDYGSGNMYSEHMARLVAWHRHYTRFWKQSALFCDWQYPDFINPHAPDMVGSTGEAEPGFINAVVGSDMSFLDGMELGRKIWNLDHAIWTLQGRHRDQVAFADYVYDGPTDEQQGTGGRHLVPCRTDGKWEYRNVNTADRMIDREAFERFKTRFYRLEGWDPDTGYPTRKTLRELNLEFVADALEKKGRLGNG
jgi:aldehyde:ferredoxin oxidoreductase